MKTAVLLDVVPFSPVVNLLKTKR
jgi:hypothetical protein